MGKIGKMVYSLLCPTKLYYNIKLMNKTVSTGNQLCLRMTGKKTDMYSIYGLLGLTLELHDVCVFGSFTHVSETLAPFCVLKVLKT